ncbi:MAG TPA: aldo/keto reductase [Candidatus Dormibacteraeota bacterium]|jgi:aryl-alcohol dehydrogenase-like predicted oxidoreductase|nr:aldo/keto reductase [Candidatus Dormibacteraeota bacterium]
MAATDAGTVTVGDLTVRRMGFGAMRVTGPGIWGPPVDLDGARAVLRRTVELGVNFIDTADAYGPRVSEQLIAEALRPYAQDLVIGTKGGLLRDGPGRWRPDGRPEHLREALEGSLRDLGLEQIQLYQLHRPDPKVPFEESVGELVRLKAEGKIRWIGLSNVTVDQLEKAMALTQVVSVQNRYNQTDRQSDDVLAACERLSLAFLPWAPIGSTAGTTAAVVERVAGAHGATPSQVALAWLLHRSPQMLVIPGTSSLAHLEENVAAAALQLTPDEIEELNAAD